MCVESRRDGEDFDHPKDRAESAFSKLAFRVEVVGGMLKNTVREDCGLSFDTSDFCACSIIISALSRTD